MPLLLERGAIAFLYRPRVETFAPRGLEDVQRFFVLLAARVRGRVRVRRVAVGRKRLPDLARRERFWATVDRVAADASGATADLGRVDYWTKTRGLRHQPGARVAADGAYALARHEDHVHLAYRLLRAARDEVREDLRVAASARFVVATFAESVGARGERRFLPLRRGHLDVVGAEMVLVSAGEDAGADVDDRAAEEARAVAGAAGFDILRRADDGRGAAPLLDGDLPWH
jgi:hypothetical protein